MLFGEQPILAALQTTVGCRSSFNSEPLGAFSPSSPASPAAKGQSRHHLSFFRAFSALLRAPGPPRNDKASGIHQLEFFQTRYNQRMAKRVIHVSDADAASNFASLLDRVREGTEVVIEHNARPVAVVRPAEFPSGRLLSESIALAKAHAKELGYEPAFDPDFAADLEEIVNSHRKPLVSTTRE